MDLLKAQDIGVRAVAGQRAHHCAVAAYHESWQRPDNGFADRVLATAAKGDARFRYASRDRKRHRRSQLFRCITQHDVGDGSGVIMSNTAFRSTGRQFVQAHGRTIEVRTLEPIGKRRTPSDKVPFEGRIIGCPIWWLQRVLQTNPDGRELVVALYIWRRHVVTKRWTFDVSNGELKAIGVGRQAKYRAFTKLEGAGLITFECENREAPVVTILTRKR
jgi:hypothetical protein